MNSADSPGFLFLKPGELFVSERPMVVSTLLGSCVAVTMFSPRQRIGAISHALLPRCPNRQGCSGSFPEGGRYVECCIAMLLEGLTSRGVAKREIEVKLFGGSSMFDDSKGGRRSVGRQNVEKALELLDREGVRVLTSDLGGTAGRKIFFHTHTGEVFLRHLRKSEI